MADVSRPVESKIAEAVERMRRVQEANRRGGRPEPDSRRVEDTAHPPPPRR